MEALFNQSAFCEHDPIVTAQMWYVVEALKSFFESYER
jgi:hypothetical protein